MKLPIRHNKKGFTLIELVVVMTMMLLLIAFVVPQFRNFTRKRVLNEEALKVTSDIETAYSLARSGVQDKTSSVDAYKFGLLKAAADSASCKRAYYSHAVNTSGTKVGDTIVKEELECPLVLETTIGYFEFDSVTGQVVVDGSGTPLASNFTINVCYPGYGSIPVTVDSQGRVIKGNFTTTPCTCTTSCGGVTFP
ncbi:type II secretion system protein [candidate division WWE3 bacterium]|uniref:Type II secretion system protein n=1 Tax=candidate division WWE3 bacterium TaxID=2053526 RepID=A0A955LKH5_UNCKA|nr:type II secretion system protein [candidate division WWE3 bacterium]